MNIAREDRSQLIVLACAAVASAFVLLNTDYFLRPGTSEVLGGLAHHAFLLVLLLVLTAGSRTVSLGTLGIFWLIGVWSVYGIAYVVEKELARLVGETTQDQFVPVWLAPSVEEVTKLAPVAAFLALTAWRGRQLAMSDGLLLGFVIGAGVSFHEDAQYGEILVSGEGWKAAEPWTLLLPVVSPLGSYFALNHALWAALSGLGVGAAMMWRHHRWAWGFLVAAFLLAFTNHLMANEYVHNNTGTTFLLNRASGNEVAWFFDLVRDVTIGGRLPMLVLVFGAVAAVATESLILRQVGQRDPLFPPLKVSHVVTLLSRVTTMVGQSQARAADRYVRLRRLLYFGGWRARQTGRLPKVPEADFLDLFSLGDRLGILPEQPGIALGMEATTGPGVALLATGVADPRGRV